MRCVCLTAAVSAMLAASAAGSVLRGVAAPAVAGDLLPELERALGAGLLTAAEGRAAQLEDAMRPIYAALPKTPDGRLPPAGVRYLLHRVFVERHAWQVRGVADNGEGWRSVSPADVLAEHVGASATEPFDRRPQGRGLSLHEAAVFGATLESLVHEEVVERLRTAFRAAGADASAAGEEDIERALDLYMLMYVRRLDHTRFTGEALVQALANYTNPTWGATVEWMRGVRREVVGASPELRSSFQGTVKAVEEAMDRYGRWQNEDCGAMKADLLKIERNGSGRVPLQDFYRAALEGQHLFSETKGYLRDLGALDESVPSRPSVIIANYINSPSNCLAGSRYYSVCCIEECEPLLKTLEHHIAAPDALPSQIAELVEQLASPTVAAPRSLPSPLLARLDEIAARHGGRVPLHGRLFAQWMHHAFPRECPFPHLAGETAPSSGHQWSVKNGEAFLADREEMERQIEGCAWGDGNSSAGGDVGETVRWSAVEDLQMHPHVKAGGVRAGLRGFSLAATAFSMALALAATARKSRRWLPLPTSAKTFV